MICFITHSPSYWMMLKGMKTSISNKQANNILYLLLTRVIWFNFSFFSFCSIFCYFFRGWNKTKQKKERNNKNSCIIPCALCCNNIRIFSMLLPCMKMMKHNNIKNIKSLQYTNEWYRLNVVENNLHNLNIQKDTDNKSEW